MACVTFELRTVGKALAAMHFRNLSFLAMLMLCNNLLSPGIAKLRPSGSFCPTRQYFLAAVKGCTRERSSLTTSWRSRHDIVAVAPAQAFNHCAIHAWFQERQELLDNVQAVGVQCLNFLGGSERGHQGEELFDVIEALALPQAFNHRAIHAWLLKRHKLFDIVPSVPTISFANSCEHHAWHGTKQAPRTPMKKRMVARPVALFTRPPKKTGIAPNDSTEGPQRSA